ncbi:MAG: caspase family protein [Rhodanobacteraceae bacterium]|nr:caspase family protein [Rhodanobacteraceae bacterium]
MAKAAVFIGVDRAGGLTPLKDAAAGAKRLYDGWASAQKFERRELLTDAGGAKVTFTQVFDTIADVLKPGDVEQLFVYFAGHGINVARHECWLLSDAPARAHEVISVTISVEQAYYCGVPHVVFISDACRTAAGSIGLQNVSGSGIFANEEPSGTEKPVDLFFGASLGRPAFEVSNDADAASGFTALYTDALKKALEFEAPDVIDWVREQGDEIGLIRPRRLRDHLGRAVSRTIRDRNLAKAIVQVPDARITSDPDAWLARRVGRPDGPEPEPADTSVITGPGTSFGFGSRGASNTSAIVVPTLPVNLRASSTSLVALALRQPDTVAELLSVTDAAGPSQFETQCGLKLRGMRAREVFALGARVEQLGPARDVIRVSPQQGRPVVLLVLDNGAGVVVPAIPGFVGALKFDDGEFIDLAYEPSANTWRAADYQRRARELQTLRQVAAAASRNGAFRLEGDDAALLARRMQLLKGVDPALAVYAAYAYRDCRDHAHLREMHGYLRSDLGASLFDVALLAGVLNEGLATAPDQVFGLFPLLTQGWVYLHTQRVRLAQDGEALQPYLLDSLWTQFDAAGVDRLRSTYFRGASPWQRVD